jgi:hypothetical protein
MATAGGWRTLVSLTVDQLAEAAHLSPRQFSRAFRAETGPSPAKAIEHLRVEAARLMIEQSRHPIDVIAAETGFADRERMRRAFLRASPRPVLFLPESFFGLPDSQPNAQSVASGCSGTRRAVYVKHWRRNVH